MTARRSLWWALTIALTLGLVGATAFGVWQWVRPLPADSVEAREAIMDIARVRAVDALNSMVRDDQAKVTAEAKAVAVESLTADAATIILFIDETVTKGAEAPTDTAISARMRLRKVDGDWVVKTFEGI